jgi:hypothetical protein
MPHVPIDLVVLALRGDERRGVEGVVVGVVVRVIPRPSGDEGDVPRELR